MAEPATCDQCGSMRVRHARSRNVVHQVVRALSDWDRYACGACGHRGWRKGKLKHRERAEPRQVAAAPGRRSEQRDLRLKRRRQLKLAATVLVAIALGVMAALVILRMSVDPARPPAP